MIMPNSQDADSSRCCTELCTIDGTTYVAIPEGVDLPIQHPEITLVAVDLTPDLKEQIKATSPHVALINSRVQTAIAERYSTADEIKLLRTAPSPEMAAYNDYAEDCRAWGRTEKAKLGL